MGVLHLDCGGGYTKLHVATPYSTIPTHTQLQAVKLVRSEYTLYVETSVHFLAVILYSTVSHWGNWVRMNKTSRVLFQLLVNL